MVNFPQSRPNDNAPFAMVPTPGLTRPSLPAYISWWARNLAFEAISVARGTCDGAMEVRR
jgi:hypothetical protein